MDTERAAGFRYSQRAYLVQVRREGAGTFLIDPVAVEDHLDGFRELMNGAEWILHAASQDLPSLRELGLLPTRLYDTELGGRLLGLDHVGLGAMVEHYFGVTLAKEHSAADWSVRPLPESWLNYAALDVEFLVPLWEKLSAELTAAGKEAWAEQEFEAERLAPEPEPRPDPWRRTHGIGDVRSARGLAVVREMWLARDEMARERDVAPSKIVNDRAIAALASRDPLPPELPQNIREFRRGNAEAWRTAYAHAMSVPTSQLPPRRGPSRGGLPEPRAWARVNPPAAARLQVVRGAVWDLAEKLKLPQENLLPPAVQRRIAWESTIPTVEEVRAIALAGGARPWQVDVVAEAVSAALIELARTQAAR